MAGAPAMPAVPRFDGDRKVDLAIVGGGYTGLSCAYYAKLFRPAWTVVVLESHKLASSASSRKVPSTRAMSVSPIPRCRYAGSTGFVGSWKRKKSSATSVLRRR